MNDLLGGIDFFGKRGLCWLRLRSVFVFIDQMRFGKFIIMILSLPRGRCELWFWVLWRIIILPALITVYNMVIFIVLAAVAGGCPVLLSVSLIRNIVGVTIDVIRRIMRRRVLVPVVFIRNKDYGYFSKAFSLAC